MTLHAIIGDGEMKAKELDAALNELWDKDEADESNFWFVLQGKSSPTATDKALCEWLDSNEVFYAIITDDADALDPCYSPAQTFKAKSFAKKLLSVLESEPEDGEATDVLALFVSDDVDAEEDRWLSEVCGELAQAGHRIRALNDGLLDLDWDQSDPEEKPESGPEEKPEPKRLVDMDWDQPESESESEPEPEVEEPEPESASEEEIVIPEREELEELSFSEIKDLATKLGIEKPPRTRVSTYIKAILGEEDSAEPEAEVEEVPESPGLSTGGLDMDEVIEMVTAQVIQRLIKALQS